jgi:hypothetical protein
MKQRRLRCWLTGVMVAVFCLDISCAASGSAQNSVPQDVFDGMRQSFRADKAWGVFARYQWELAGLNGGEWWIDVNNGTFRMGRGKIDRPDVTFISSARDWVAISNGKLNGTWAVITGRLKVRGDRRLARKLDEIFP